MSRLQTAAKPIVLPMILGETVTLDADMRQVLAAWVTMLFMVFEFGNPETAGATDEDRKSFSENQLPPRNWRVFAGLLSEHLSEAGIAHFGGVSPVTAERVTIGTVPMGLATFHAFAAPSRLEEAGTKFAISAGYAKVWTIDKEPIVIDQRVTEADMLSVALRLREAFILSTRLFTA